MFPSHLVIVFALVAAPVARWADGSCSRDEAIKAEKSVGTLKSWPDVFASFQRFRHCDDAAIAEGYSESITKILDSHWSTIGSLHALSRHGGFLDFVLRHIDDTVPADRLTPNRPARAL
jgi:hypothetical protein